MTAAYEESLPLSGLQHYAFCPRQWALIHVEGQWEENMLTAEGRVMHEAAHDPLFSESRSGVVSVRSLWLASNALGVVGMTDVVEYLPNVHGITLPRRKGRYAPYPIEYKRGKPKAGNFDRIQLCAQAVCLEEMHGCAIQEGALYYAAVRRREVVAIDAALRDETARIAQAMHAAYRAGQTPRAEKHKGCERCSIVGQCLPGLGASAQRYIAQAVETLTMEEGEKA